MTNTSVPPSPLVLSLFPGADLLGRAFEELGCCVVRGPDPLLAGDVKTFHPPAGRFDGVIGGPPCQCHSTAAITGSNAEDLIPEFVRVVHEAQPRFVVMENIPGAWDHAEVPGTWSKNVLVDWDCGGLTFRKRVFWTWPFMFLAPPKRPGQPEHSVLASDWKRGASGICYRGRKAKREAEECERLQGWQLPGLSKFYKNLAIHMLGNGVPRAMGLYVARFALRSIEVRETIEATP